MTRLVEDQLALLRDDRAITAIRRQLVTPFCVERIWDYDDEVLPCWTVLEHPESNTAIAWCGRGFGTAMPWGLVQLSGTRAEMSMGMDSSWFFTLGEAWYDSPASAGLPVWRVFEGYMEQSGFHAVTPEGCWKETWAAMEALQRQNPGVAYTVDADDYVRLRRLP